MKRPVPMILAVDEEKKMITMNFTTVNFARGSILFENDDLFMFIV